MITNAAAGLAFLHIPKNAGSTLRDQLQPYDDFNGLFSGQKEHADLGSYDSAHVPLIWLRDYWPDAFNTVSKLDLFAVTRDPMERLTSALSQRIRQHRGRQPSELSQSEIFSEIDLVRAHLAQMEAFPDYEFIHFCRQTDFTHLDDRRLVENIYPIGALPALIAELGSRMDLKLMDDIQVNRTVTFRYSSSAGVLIKAKDLAKSILPFGLYSRLREKSMKVFTTDGALNLTKILQDSSELQAFLTDHYAEDFILHAAAEDRLRRVTTHAGAENA